MTNLFIFSSEHRNGASSEYDGPKFSEETGRVAQSITRAGKISGGQIGAEVVSRPAALALFRELTRRQGDAALATALGQSAAAQQFATRPVAAAEGMPAEPAERTPNWAYDANGSIGELSAKAAAVATPTSQHMGELTSV